MSKKMTTEDAAKLLIWRRLGEDSGMKGDYIPYTKEASREANNQARDAEDIGGKFDNPKTREEAIRRDDVIRHNMKNPGIWGKLDKIIGVEDKDPVVRAKLMLAEKIPYSPEYRRKLEDGGK